MEISHYHTLTKDNIHDIAHILLECFAEDPLYQKLVPQPQKRAKILEDIFECDAAELLNYCDVFSDSEENKGIIIITDSTEKRSSVKRFWAEKLYEFKTDMLLIKNDLSLKTLFRFFLAHKYLYSKWTSKLNTEKHIHIIYFAVRKQYHGCGIAHKLISPILDYADKNGIVVTLETHNEKNISLYGHYGFEVYEQFATKIGLVQYCLLRNPKWIDAEKELKTTLNNINPQKLAE